MSRLPSIQDRRVLLAAGALSLLLFFVAGYELGKTKITQGRFIPRSIANRESGQPHDVDFSLFWSVWERIISQYPDQIDAQKAVYGAIAGAVRSLGDPYSDFFTPEETKVFEQEISGSFEGVGIELGERDGRIVVIAPVAGTPAARAGIQALDTIRKVDQRDIEGLTLSQIIKLIRGPHGSEVTLTVIRNGEQKVREFALRREKIQVPSVVYEERRTPGGKVVSYIKLSQFSEDTDHDFSEVVSRVILAQPAGMVLDLRNNPGGYFDAAVAIGSYFISERPIATEVDKSGRVMERGATHDATLRSFPLIVLVNQGSASASEIVAGAIQDYGIGQIFGEKSFGKGTVQSFEKLKDGSSIKVTVGKWLTAKGREINKIGIAPDREVKDDPATTVDEALNEALSELDHVKRVN